MVHRHVLSFIVSEVKMSRSCSPKAKAIQGRVRKQNNYPSFGNRSTSSRLPKRGQFQAYLTAQAQNAVPRSLTFLTYQTYQNSNTFFCLRLLIVLHNFTPFIRPLKPLTFLFPVLILYGLIHLKFQLCLHSACVLKNSCLDVQL